MQELIDKEKPKIVVIYLGINDVWHGAKGTTKPDYEAGLKKMIDMCKKAKATTILCTPTIIGEEKNNKLTNTLGEYSEIVRKLAKENKLTLCDLHKAFIDELKKINKDNKHAGNLTYDGVHMKPEGNTILADKISAAIVTALKNRNK
jgi:lysophospholipase L1-like esterase